MFSVGDQVLHPLHGAGTVTSVSIRQNGGVRQKYYALHLALDDVVLYIPVRCSAQIGLRYICSAQEAEQVLCGKIGALPPQPANWNDRYRENMNRIRSGDMYQVARVTACLWLRGRRRALAGSEKRVMECAERILYSELMLATGLSRCEVQQRLEQQWKKLRSR